ncbi:penicillin-binding protein activator [Microvirga flavescens]|uniref:penicillin-binding protein activator n=1 Tax=Microvirga flavescens TaxID=2249811 RepID=UPI000DDC03E2
MVRIRFDRRFDRQGKGLSSRAVALLALALPVFLAGCIGSGSMTPPRRVASAPAQAAPQPAYGQPVEEAMPGQAPAPVYAGAPSGMNIGTGNVRVALILPFSSPGQGAIVAQSMRNAAELALGDFQGSDITLLVKDDRGTPDGAREATQQAVAEGAELILGPVFAGSVQGAGQVARQAGRPMIAFSTDASVAGPGIYLLSFLVQEEVDRIVSYAARQGHRSIAALIPETTYGTVVEARFRETAARSGLRVVAIERYPAGQPQGAVQRIANVIGGGAPQADSLLIPDNTDGLNAVARALQTVGYDPQRVRPLGTGVWNEARVFALPQLQGGWFAAPDSRGFEAFAGRYRARFNTDPTRLATLSYDAVTLAAALTRTQGSRRFAEDVLTNPAGFAGADGVFRFKADGMNNRALAVQEVRNGGAVAVNAAPRALTASAY